MKYKPKIEKETMCPIEYGLDIFSGKWKSRIICVLSSTNGIRYNDIRGELDNITDAVLTAVLIELIADKLISREQYNEFPPRVEYSLTEKGKSVFPILQSICQWSRQQMKDEPDKKPTPCKTACKQIS